MAKIKFSHDYMKLPEKWDDTEAVLLKVVETNTKHLPKSFLEWDTRFRGEEGHYNLPEGPVILLFFSHVPTGQVFTTIRRFTEQKLDYYDRCEDDTFIMMRTYEE